MGQNFKIVTEYNSARNAFTKKDNIPRIGRWFLKIQESDFVIKYKGGQNMQHVDVLSQNPFGDQIELKF